MPYQQTFPDGKVLTSSALSVDDMNSLMQQVICFCFGITNNKPVNGIVILGNNVVAVDDLNGVAVGYKVKDVASGFGIGQFGLSGYGGPSVIPDGTTITAIDQNAKTITLSKVPTGNANEVLFITDPLAGSLVRQSWPTSGAPAYGINDNITFVRCTEVSNSYDRVKDEGYDVNDAVSGLLEIEYTRVWNVFCELRGPTAYQRGTILKSAMQLEFILALLAQANVYVVPDIAPPIRLPELFESKWWERADINIDFNEQVNESIVIPTVASVEVSVSNSNGVELDFVVEA